MRSTSARVVRPRVLSCPCWVTVESVEGSICTQRDPFFLLGSSTQTVAVGLVLRTWIDTIGPLQFGMTETPSQSHTIS
jgi:hypothetical protein